MQAFDADRQPAFTSGTESTSVSLRREGAAAVLTARGEFDAVTTPRLQAAIREALEGGPGVLVLDLTGVEFFASSAPAALVEAQRVAGDRTEVRLAVEHRIARTLTLLGLDGLFAQYPSAAEAVAGK
ncbi:STAS domain-containing protein [Amycolatopsis sp. NPDC051903]|uniref:STAS domain-containing protein n=1 Tax=Amycolatopsis sp. NPDC051903 TaxID=3363936 RepID=UPI003793E909